MANRFVGSLVDVYGSEIKEFLDGYKINYRY